MTASTSLSRQQVLDVLKDAGRPAVFVRGGLGGALAIDAPQVADGDHFDVVSRLQPGDDGRKFAAAIADADVAEADAIVRADDASVGDGRGPEESRACQKQRSTAEIV